MHLIILLMNQSVSKFPVMNKISCPRSGSWLAQDSRLECDDCSAFPTLMSNIIWHSLWSTLHCKQVTNDWNHETFYRDEFALNIALQNYVIITTRHQSLCQNLLFTLRSETEVCQRSAKTDLTCMPRIARRPTLSHPPPLVQSSFYAMFMSRVTCHMWDNTAKIWSCDIFWDIKNAILGILS